MHSVNSQSAQILMLSIKDLGRIQHMDAKTHEFQYHVNVMALDK